jgi:hypothetical protein
MFKATLLKRVKYVVLGTAITASVLTTASQQVSATGATVSGTVTAGNVAVPAGSFQIVFIPYAFSNCSSPSGFPTGASTIVPVGSGGQFSVNLPRARYRVAFKALSSAPANSLGAWYSNTSTAGVASGTDPSNCLLVDSTPVTINHTTTGTRVAFDGTLETSTGAPVTSALVSLSNSRNDWYMTLDGAGGAATPDGTWEMGLPQNKDVWLQVKVPATPTGQLFCGVKNGQSFTLVASLGTAPVQYCDESYRFNFGSSSQQDVRLQLPVMGLISGQVTGTDGSVARASEVCVTAYKSGSDAVNWYSQSAGSSCTNESGRFELGVPFDSNPQNIPSLVTKYRLQFNSGNSSSPYMSRWYATSSTTDSYASASDISVTSTTRNITANIALPIGKSISGTVRTSSGEPVAGASVTAMSYSNATTGPLGVRGALSGPDGSYRIGGIQTGTYSVKASHPDFGSQWLGGGNAETATRFAIQVSDSAITNKDFSLSPGKSISGALTTADGGTSQVCVAAYRVSESEAGWGEFTQSGCFTAPGGWSLRGLQSGNYKIRFDVRDGDYKSQFLGNTPDFSRATVVSVGESNISGQDITFGKTKSIVLKLVNDDAAAITSACIIAFKIDPTSFWGRTWQTMTCANTGGTYRLRGIEVADYVLQVTTQGTDYRPGYYSNSGKLSNSDNATSLSISSSDNLVDLGTTTLYRGPKIEMTMKFGAATVSNICVNAILIKNDFSWGEHAGSACAGSNGQLVLRGLVEGNYRIQVNSTNEYRGGWITSTGSISNDIQNARRVSVGSSNIDLANIAVVAGTKAIGRILFGGSGVGNVCINAIRDTGIYENSVCSLNNGEFVLPGLDPTGSYRFRITSAMGDFKQGYLNNNGEIQNSLTGITARSSTSDIALGEIVLASAPSIKGTFISGVSTPEPNVCVSAIESSTQSWVSSSCSSSSGAFALRGLESNGTYKLTWWTQNKSLSGGWYKNQSGPTQTSSFADASEITVPSGGVQNLMIRIRNGAIITGTTPDGICVAAWREPASNAVNRSNASAIACGDNLGRFELRGLTESVNYYLEAFRKDGSPVVQSSPGVNEAVQAGANVVVTAS